MEFMSLVANTLDEAGREALLSCSSASEMYSVLAGEKRR
jgi:mannitol/fructose-specific phosphotransferase system IIA component (Ntr-type)